MHIWNLHFNLILNNINKYHNIIIIFYFFYDHGESSGNWLILTKFLQKDFNMGANRSACLSYTSWWWENKKYIGILIIFFQNPVGNPWRAAGRYISKESVWPGGEFFREKQNRSMYRKDTGQKFPKIGWSMWIKTMGELYI